MYACGLRASEAIGLDVRDVDLTLGVLRARG
jgi:integrase/recombinase XerD